MSRPYSRSSESSHQKGRPGKETVQRMHYSSNSIDLRSVDKSDDLRLAFVLIMWSKGAQRVMASTASDRCLRYGTLSRSGWNLMTCI